MQQPLFRPYIEGPLAAALGVNETRAGDVRRVSELLPPTLRQNVSTCEIIGGSRSFKRRFCQNGHDEMRRGSSVFGPGGTVTRSPPFRWQPCFRNSTRVASPTM